MPEVSAKMQKAIDILDCCESTAKTEPKQCKHKALLAFRNTKRVLVIQLASKASFVRRSIIAWTWNTDLDIVTEWPLRLSPFTLDLPVATLCNCASRTTFIWPLSWKLDDTSSVKLKSLPEFHACMPFHKSERKANDICLTLKMQPSTWTWLLAEAAFVCSLLRHACIAVQYYSDRKTGLDDTMSACSAAMWLTPQTGL